MENHNNQSFFEKISTKITSFTGSTPAIVGAFLIILIWAVTGPIFDFSNTWQLVINTATTIITFLMVFVIQRSQNKESLSIQLKLNELLAALKGASVDMINIEKLSENDLQMLLDRYEELVTTIRKSKNSKVSISVQDVDNKEVRDIKEDIKDIKDKTKNK